MNDTLNCRIKLREKSLQISRSLENVLRSIGKHKIGTSIIHRSDKRIVISNEDTVNASHIDVRGNCDVTDVSDNCLDYTSYPRLQAPFYQNLIAKYPQAFLGSFQTKCVYGSDSRDVAHDECRSNCNCGGNVDCGVFRRKSVYCVNLSETNSDEKENITDKKCGNLRKDFVNSSNHRLKHRSKEVAQLDQSTGDPAPTLKERLHNNTDDLRQLLGKMPPFSRKKNGDQTKRKITLVSSWDNKQTRSDLVTDLQKKLAIKQKDLEQWRNNLLTLDKLYSNNTGVINSNEKALSAGGKLEYSSESTPALFTSADYSLDNELYNVNEYCGQSSGECLTSVYGQTDRPGQQVPSSSEYEITRSNALMAWSLTQEKKMDIDKESLIPTASIEKNRLVRLNGIRNVSSTVVGFGAVSTPEFQGRVTSSQQSHVLELEKLNRPPSAVDQEICSIIMNRNDINTAPTIGNNNQFIVVDDNCNTTKIVKLEGKDTNANNRNVTDNASNGGICNSKEIIISSLPSPESSREKGICREDSNHSVESSDLDVVPLSTSDSEDGDEYSDFVLVSALMKESEDVQIHTETNPLSTHPMHRTSSPGKLVKYARCDNLFADDIISEIDDVNEDEDEDDEYDEAPLDLSADKSDGMFDELSNLSDDSSMDTSIHEVSYEANGTEDTEKMTVPESVDHVDKADFPTPIPTTQHSKYIDDEVEYSDCASLITAIAEVHSSPASTEKLDIQRGSTIAGETTGIEKTEEQENDYQSDRPSSSSPSSLVSSLSGTEETTQPLSDRDDEHHGKANTTRAPITDCITTVTKDVDSDEMDDTDPYRGLQQITTASDAEIKCAQKYRLKKAEHQTPQPDDLTLLNPEKLTDIEELKEENDKPILSLPLMNTEMCFFSEPTMAPGHVTENDGPVSHVEQVNLAADSVDDAVMITETVSPKNIAQNMTSVNTTEMADIRTKEVTNVEDVQHITKPGSNLELESVSTVKKEPPVDGETRNRDISTGNPETEATSDKIQGALTNESYEVIPFKDIYEVLVEPSSSSSQPPYARSTSNPEKHVITRQDPCYSPVDDDNTHIYEDPVMPDTDGEEVHSSVPCIYEEPLYDDVVIELASSPSELMMSVEMSKKKSAVPEAQPTKQADVNVSHISNISSMLTTIATTADIATTVATRSDEIATMVVTDATTKLVTATAAGVTAKAVDATVTTLTASPTINQVLLPVDNASEQAPPNLIKMEGTSHVASSDNSTPDTLTPCELPMTDIASYAVTPTTTTNSAITPPDFTPTPPPESVEFPLHYASTDIIDFNLAMETESLIICNSSLMQSAPPLVTFGKRDETSGTNKRSACQTAEQQSAVSVYDGSGYHLPVKHTTPVDGCCLNTTCKSHSELIVKEDVTNHTKHPFDIDAIIVPCHQPLESSQTEGKSLCSKVYAPDIINSITEINETLIEFDDSAKSVIKTGKALPSRAKDPTRFMTLTTQPILPQQTSQQTQKPSPFLAPPRTCSLPWSPDTVQGNFWGINSTAVAALDCSPSPDSTGLPVPSEMNVINPAEAVASGENDVPVTKHPENEHDTWPNKVAKNFHYEVGRLYLNEENWFDHPPAENVFLPDEGDGKGSTIAEIVASYSPDNHHQYNPQVNGSHGYAENKNVDCVYDYPHKGILRTNGDKRRNSIADSREIILNSGLLHGRRSYGRDRLDSKSKSSESSDSSDMEKVKVIIASDQSAKQFEQKLKLLGKIIDVKSDAAKTDIVKMHPDMDVKTQQQPKCEIESVLGNQKSDIPALKKCQNCKCKSGARPKTLDIEKKCLDVNEKMKYPCKDETKAVIEDNGIPLTTEHECAVDVPASLLAESEKILMSQSHKNHYQKKQGGSQKTKKERFNKNLHSTSPESSVKRNKKGPHMSNCSNTEVDSADDFGFLKATSLVANTKHPIVLGPEYARACEAEGDKIATEVQQRIHSDTTNKEYNKNSLLHKLFKGGKKGNYHPADAESVMIKNGSNKLALEQQQRSRELEELLTRELQMDQECSTDDPGSTEAGINADFKAKLEKTLSGGKPEHHHMASSNEEREKLQSDDSKASSSTGSCPSSPQSTEEKKALTDALSTHPLFTAASKLNAHKDKLDQTSKKSTLEKSKETILQDYRNMKETFSHDSSSSIQNEKDMKHDTSDEIDENDISYTDIKDRVSYIRIHSKDAKPSVDSRLIGELKDTISAMHIVKDREPPLKPSKHHKKNPFQKLRKFFHAKQITRYSSSPDLRNTTFGENSRAGYSIDSNFVLTSRCVSMDAIAEQPNEGDLNLALVMMPTCETIAEGDVSMSTESTDVPSSLVVENPIYAKVKKEREEPDGASNPIAHENGEEIERIRDDAAVTPESGPPLPDRNYRSGSLRKDPSRSSLTMRMAKFKRSAQMKFRSLRKAMSMENLNQAQSYDYDKEAHEHTMKNMRMRINLNDNGSDKPYRDRTEHQTIDPIGCPLTNPNICSPENYPFKVPQPPPPPGSPVKMKKASSLMSLIHIGKRSGSASSRSSKHRQLRKWSNEMEAPGTKQELGPSATSSDVEVTPHRARKLLVRPSSTPLSKLKSRMWGSTQSLQASVENPTQPRVIGRLLEFNPDGSQMIELNRLSEGSLGFFIGKGNANFHNGTFVSRFTESNVNPMKLFSGLINIGDEILEINGVSVRPMELDEVYCLMKDSNKLVLKVLPMANRKDVKKESF